MNLTSPPPQPPGDRSQSLNKDVREKLAQATELESKYTLAISSVGAKNESNIQQLRTKLCEQFSDVLLMDPSYSNRKDVSGRMWRACFHGRVQELRDRITKEKARVRKIQHKTKSQSTNPGPDEESERQQQILIEHLEKNLNTFLKEAVLLYEFLIDKYQGFLLPHLSSQITQTPATPTTPMTVPSTKINMNTPSHDQDQEISLEGVVPLLHKMFIHLGDLLRYSNSFAQAEAAYLKATRLAPGRGNPYNQLAVIGQIKNSNAPLSVTVLYWYCRSLLATDDPFPTALANLDRFFTLTCKETSDLDGDTTLPTSTAGLNREKARALKGVRNRNFLQAFTDFHGRIFFALSNKESSQCEPRMKMTDYFATIDKLLSQLDWLLEESSFSDALLNKMIVINVSSFWNLLNAQHKSKSEYTMVALTWLLEFGAHLIQYFIPLMEKVVTKQISQGVSSGNMSVRLFTPILFVYEFVLSLWRSNEQFKLLWESDMDGDGNKTNLECRPKCDESLKHFWCNIAQVANVIKTFEVDDVSIHENDPVDALPHDYEDMRGFKPFESCLLESSSGSRETILSPKEAVIALELDPLNSQATSRVEADSEFSVKINRFLFLLRNSSHAIEMNADGFYCYRSSEKLDHDSGTEHDVNFLLDPIMVDKLLDDDEEGAGDDIVYQIPVVGISPGNPSSTNESQTIPSTIKNVVRPPPGFLPIHDQEFHGKGVPLTSNNFHGWNSSSSLPQLNMPTTSTNPFFFPMPSLGQDNMNRDKVDDDKAASFHPFRFSSPFTLGKMALGDKGSDEVPLFTHNPFY